MSLIIGLNGGGGGGAAANYKAVIAWDGNSVPVVADIPAGVVVKYNRTSYTGTLMASSTTKKYVYLVKAGSGVDAYDEYKTYQNIADGTWFWDKVGSCRIDLTPYRTAEAQDAIDEATSDVVAAALTQIMARLDAIERRLAPDGNLGKVNIDDLSVIKTFNNYTV